MGLTDCPKTSVAYYHSMLCKIPEHNRSHLIMTTFNLHSISSNIDIQWELLIILWKFCMKLHKIHILILEILYL